MELTIAAMRRIIVGILILPLLLLGLGTPVGGAARSEGSPCLTRYTLDGTAHCSMDEAGLGELETSENTGEIERRVQESCAAAGLSSQNCAHLMSATVKSAGEEVAWRRDRSARIQSRLDRRLESREDAIQMLSDWGWGKTVWLFGDSHMRKMARTLLRALETGSETRQVVGNHEDCGIVHHCWCPTIFRIFQDNGRVERLDFRTASNSASASSTTSSITLVFRYFVVRCDDDPPLSSDAQSYGTYDRPCVFKEGAATIAETIRRWQKNHLGKSTALVDPDVIIFNAGNWESNEEWEVDAFEEDMGRRAKALQTAFLPTSGTIDSNKDRKKLIFLGPPFFDDRVSHLKECPAKWGPKTSTRMAAFSEVAVQSLRAAGVETLDVFSVTKEASSDQYAFWQALGWTGGVRYELCSNHQIPSMYMHFWRLLTELIIGVEEKEVEL